MKDNLLPLSILMSVYHREDPVYLEAALKSLIDQTKLPSEIVLVQDGLLTDGLYYVIEKCKAESPIPIVMLNLDTNVGLGTALSLGLKICKFEIIARMDSDDLCVGNRFETQFNFLQANQEIAVVGSSIEDFHKTPGDLGILRVLPRTGNSLIKFSKYRSPVNHATIMFRKTAVMESGNYNGDIRLFEDFSLFIRMLKKGFNFYNLEEVLYYVRVGSGIEAIKRRSGLHYVKSEVIFLNYAFKLGHLSKVELLLSYLTKIPIRMLPPRVLYFVYNKFLRSS